jgi:uncharacterized protein (TIGR00369 family)
MTTVQTTAEEATGAQVPEGFEPFDHLGPFVRQYGPFYLRRVPGGVILALRLGPQHMNRRGVCHGGLLATMIDDAVAINCSIARGRRGDQATVSLTTEFLSSARLGDWLEAHTTLRRVGRRMVFGDCLLTAGDRQVARGSAIYAVGLGAGGTQASPSAPDGK